MRIVRLELDGFGRFADARWEFGAGLSVLVGRNEAGKTTLLNAIRALLFGFEASRDGRTWYPALAGGRRGGRLVLLRGDAERWIIERHAERGGNGSLVVTAPTGNRGGPETLDRLLAGADRDLFRSIFAFGLEELSSLHSLSSEAIRGRIYGAGAGMGGASVLDVERGLRRELDDAFRPSGRNQRLNALLAEIDRLQGEIAELELLPAEHTKLNGELAQLRERREALRGERTDALAQRQRLAQLIAAKPLAGELDAFESELAALDPSLDAIPRDAGAELARREAAADDARARLADLDEQVAARRASRDEQPFDEALPAAAADIVALRDERLGQGARERDRTEALAAAGRHADELRELCRRVGGWEPEALLGVDDSIASHETVRETEARLVVLDRVQNRAADRLRSARESVAVDAAELGPGAPDPSEATSRRAALVALRELPAEFARLEERERLLGLLDGATSRGTGPVGGWLVPAGAAVAGAALILVGELALDSPLVGGGAAVVGAFLLALAAWLTVRSARLPQLHAGVEALPRRSEALAAERRGIEDRRRELLTRSGLPADADAALIAAAEAELAVASARSADHVARRERLAERQRQVAHLTEEVDAATRALDEARAGWIAWLVDHGLPPETSPSAARQLVEASRQARRAAAERDAATDRAAAAAEAVEAFERRLAALFERLGRRLPTEASLRSAALLGVVEELDRAVAAQRRRGELERQVAELGARRPALATTLEERITELSRWIERLGGSDADALRGRIRQAEARRELLAAIGERRQRLAGIAGGDAAVGALLAEVRRADPARLAAERAESEDRAARLADEEAAALQRHGALESEIRRLESAVEPGERRQRLALLEDRAAEEARQWATRAIALRLLEETRRRYERERQPQVIRQAERYFATITGGRYLRILAPPGEGTVRVEPAEGPAKEPDELSRGTAEQLYLALRFGLIEEFARGAEPLPVVMDDILVNFDPDRKERAAAAIAELAEGHQVVYFTCDPSTARMLDADGRRTTALD